jgi:outer membrane protein TolC
MMPRIAGIALAAVLLGSGSLGAQAPPDSLRLTITESVRRALEGSEEVRVARAQVENANAQARAARSALMPQVTTSLLYTKTLRSVFQNVGFTLPDSMKFEPDSLGSVPDRLRYLEEKTPNAALGALGSMFSNLPFGRENAWTMAASITQPLFAGGRILYSVSLANHAADAAESSLQEVATDVALQVRLAYLGAKLAGEAETIVGTSVQLARSHLERVQLQLETGRASELDVLRAEVELQNLLPQQIEAEHGYALAVLNLKRLVNVPSSTAVVLATALDPAGPELPALESALLPQPASVQQRLALRAAVRAADEMVELRRTQVKVSRSAYLPTLGLSGNFARQAYPAGIWPEGDWRDDWNVSLALQWTFFQGLRRGAELDASQAQLREAQLQRTQLLEAVQLEYQQAEGDVARARAQIATAATTVRQAERVHDLTQMRFGEGLATQLDVSAARLALQQARLNAARAYHDFYAALARAERALGVPPRDSWKMP